MKRAELAPLRKPGIKKGDRVQVIAGKAKGQVGEVLRVDPRRHTVLVKEVNMQMHHNKPRQQGRPGGIVPMEGPLHYSNVLRYCEACNSGVRKICENPEQCRSYQRSKRA
jgi:large subunit ribosomal protein L24